jgi:hypothetical protein
LGIFLGVGLPSANPLFTNAKLAKYLAQKIIREQFSSDLPKLILR